MALALEDRSALLGASEEGHLHNLTGGAGWSAKRVDGRWHNQSQADLNLISGIGHHYPWSRSRRQGGGKIHTPKPHTVPTAPNSGGKNQATRALYMILGWHVSAVVVFVGWVLTWPGEVSTGGDFSFTTSRWGMAFLLAVLAVGPALCISVSVACGVFGVLAALLKRRSWSGIAVGMIANLVGLAVIVAAGYMLSVR